MTRARPSPASTVNSPVGMHLNTRGGGGGGAGVGEVGRSEGGGGGRVGGAGGGGGFASSDFRLPEALLFGLLLAIGFQVLVSEILRWWEEKDYESLRGKIINTPIEIQLLD